MVLDTFAPDTPAFMLSDYTEERCHELGLPCVRDDNGLTVTVPAKPDGLPDWERFLAVAKDLRAADGWVMEGAKAWRSIAWCAWAGYVHDDESHRPDEIPDDIFNALKNDDNPLVRHLTDMAIYAYPLNADLYFALSCACVAYSRSGGTNE